MKERKISLRLQGSILDSVEYLSQKLHVSVSEAIRLFIRKDKIVVIQGFEKLIPVLADLTMMLEQDENPVYENKLKEGVDRIWQLLNLLTQSQSED